MNALRSFRKNQGKTRREMAEILEISLSFYEKIEYGDRAISGNVVRKIKDKFPLVDVNVFFLPENNTNRGKDV